MTSKTESWGAEPVSEADLIELVSDLYLGALALLLVALCSPKGCDICERRDQRPGKAPHEKDWNKKAIARYKSGTGRDAHICRLAAHAARGGNIGWCVPPGALVLDADTPEGVAWCEEHTGGEGPRQRTANGAHFVVQAPRDLSVPNAVKIEVMAGVRIDLRSAGKGQIAVAPSTHWSGVAYEWDRELS